MKMNYLVYDEDTLVGGFVSRAVAEVFMESWRENSPRRIYLVDGSTGEVLDAWVHGAWANGDF